MTGVSDGRGPDDVELRPAPRARQLRWLAVATAVALVLAGAVWLVRRGGAPEPRPDATAAGTFRPSAQQLKTLTIATVASHRFASTEFTDGRIAVNANRATPVYSPFSGRVVALAAAPGDTVAAGAVLASIEASEFVQAQTDLESATAQATLTRRSEARKHALYEAQGASLQDWQQSQADLANAEAALQSARNRLRILGKSDGEIDALAGHGHIDARVPLRAPLAGVVVDRQVGPGQYVQAGSSTPLFTIADVASVWLVGNVRESEAARMRRGQPVEVQVPAWPQRLFRARLNYVAAVVDPGTHRLTVRAEIPNGDGALKPEMLASFRIITSEAVEAPAVPEAAVVYEGERAHIWVVGADGLIGLRTIRTGRVNDGLVEVLDGARPGERVVTRGSLFIDRAARLD
jgi:cobalt-zinc-cadmium efflux system membrane fusion protein